MKTLVISLVCWLAITHASAETRIAVLDFELNDITSLPDTPQERQRTAAMAPLLIEALNRNPDYRVTAVPREQQQIANGSFGYLFRYPDEAAKLGRQLDSDWLVVAQHSKPSYLFSYLWVYLIDVAAAKAVARYDIELKGNHHKVTQHAIQALAGKLEQSLATPPRRSGKPIAQSLTGGVNHVQQTSH